MAETITTRVGLIRYGAGTDMLSRVDYNTAVDALEEKVAIDDFGAALPAAGIRGTYFTVDSTGVVYRDNGTTWVGVATNQRSPVIQPATVNDIGLSIDSLADQVAEIVRVRNSAGTTLLSVAANGDIVNRGNRIILLANPTEDQYIATLTPTSTQANGLQIILPDASVKNFLSAKHTTGAVLFRVDDLGRVRTPRLISDGAGITGDIDNVYAINFDNSIARKKLDFGGKAEFGVHSDLDLYLRSDGAFYFYRDGEHSDTPGDPGSGGVLTFKIGGAGSVYGDGTAHFVGSGTPGVLDTSVYNVTVGNLAGNNVIYGKTRLQSRNNGAAAEFSMNLLGGSLTMGDEALSPIASLRSVSTRLRGGTEIKLDAPDIEVIGSMRVGEALSRSQAFLINGYRIHIGGMAPADPEIGDIWLEV